jgi:hypothetical protein
MKQFFTTAILGAALVAGSAPQAKATAIASITVGQLMSAINATNWTSASLITGCTGTSVLSRCGLWEIGLFSDSNTSNANISTVTPQTSPSSFWSAGTSLLGPTSGWQQTGVVGNATTLALVYCNSGTVGTPVNGCNAASAKAPTGVYDTAATGGATASGASLISASTALSWLIPTGTVGSSDNLVIGFRVVGIDQTTGAETSGSKGNATVQINGITLTATPEPGSIFLFLSGVAALGFGKFRRRNV